ncbi:MAG TPA: D-alanyl-D-alanine carboxypeptidase family protein [Smithellaceae bacterium]|nr:D-alanyl-D-alanine carboxypeptidase family protein [Smithellaceae bacterium]
MNFLRNFCLFFVTVFLLVAGAAAAEKQSFEYRAALVVDMDSGKILYEHDADRLIQPASLAKILALYLLQEDIRAGRVRLDDMVKVSAKAVNTNGSKILHEEGREIPLADLMKGMAILSANDATVAVAEHLAGSVSSFVARMNAKARELGMSHSYFVNPHGLPDSHQFSTARDVYLLSSQYLRRFPDSLSIHSVQYYMFNNVTRHNRNTLLKECADVDGLKTGYVRASGYHLVATAKRENTRLIVVVMGAKNPQIRNRQTKMLLEMGFNRLGNKKHDSLIGA